MIGKALFISSKFCPRNTGTVDYFVRVQVIPDFFVCLFLFFCES